MTQRPSVPSRLTAAVVAIAALLVALPAPAGATDPVLCQGYEATIVGTNGEDTLVGTAGDDVIHGLGGRDTIDGRGGNDIICGGGGGDTIDGGLGDDDIWGQGGNDKIKGNKGTDRIRAGHHNDRVWGNGGGGDTVWGGSGSDTCIAEQEANCELDTRWGHDPDEWLPLLDEYFGDIGETANARIVLGCESLGEPFIVNPASGTTGLFQYRDYIWDWMNQDLGVPESLRGEVRVHPEASIATARAHYEWALANQGYGWAPWENCGCHPDIESPGKPATCTYVGG